MAIETKRVTVCDTEFEITQFGGWKGIQLGRKILKIIAPVLPYLMAASEDGAGMYDIVSMSGDIFDEVDDALIKEILSLTYKDKRELNIDVDFAGNYDTLILLIVEVIKFNWGKSVFSLAHNAFGA